MNILITGGNGFVGANIITNLILNKPEVSIHVIDNESKCQKLNYQQINYVKGDIRNKKDLDQFNHIDVIIHLAADTRVIDSINDPYKNFDVNCLGTMTVLEYSMRKNVKKIIFASTGGAIIGNQSPPVTEETFPRPISPYGASKLACESYIHAFSKSYGLDYCSLRFTNIYGPNSLHKESVVAHFIKKVIKNEGITIYGDGKQTRDYIFVKDIAEIVIKSIDSKFNGVYQLGSGVGTSLNELISHIKQASNSEIQINFESKRAGEIDDTWADISKATSSGLIGELTPIQEGIKQTYNWFKINKFE